MLKTLSINMSSVTILHFCTSYISSCQWRLSCSPWWYLLRAVCLQCTSIQQDMWKHQCCYSNTWHGTHAQHRACHIFRQGWFPCTLCKQHKIKFTKHESSPSSANSNGSVCFFRALLKWLKGITPRERQPSHSEPVLPATHPPPLSPLLFFPFLCYSRCN